VPDLSDEAVRAIFDELSEAAADAPEAVRKALAQAFVHELRVLDRQTVQPTFRVLPGSPLHGGPLQPQQGCAYTDKQSGRNRTRTCDLSRVKTARWTADDGRGRKGLVSRSSDHMPIIVDGGGCGMNVGSSVRTLRHRSVVVTSITLCTSGQSD
jgi:hypothetical protein